MGRITFTALAMLALLGFGCGDDDGAGAGGSSGTGGTGGNSGTGGTPVACDNSDADGGVENDPNCINALCPAVSPTTGAYAMKGACCFRASNADRAKAAWDANGLATLEFRQNALRTLTQPATVGFGAIQDSLVNTYEQDWSNTLVRVEGVPETGSGPVTVTIGAGRSNCDGTYSFYGDAAAPDHEGRTEADRWEASVMMGTWDWDSDEKLTIPDAERPAGVRWAPVAKNHGLFGYEQPSQDLNYEFSFEGSSGDTVTPEALNCIGGEVVGPMMWSASLVQTTFFPVDKLKEARVDSLALTQNFCSFMGIGFMATQLCDDVPQDMWLEKPFGMCDEDHCYIGDENHPDADCGTTDKPCCDPDGVDTPACNAFVIEARAVLAGAEITDADHNDSATPFPNCTL